MLRPPPATLVGPGVAVLCAPLVADASDICVDLVDDKEERSDLADDEVAWVGVVADCALGDGACEVDNLGDEIGVGVGVGIGIGDGDGEGVGVDGLADATALD